jgi:hypothetical protein
LGRFGCGNRLFDRYDAYLATIGSNQPDLTSGDFFVY